MGRFKNLLELMEEEPEEMYLRYYQFMNKVKRWTNNRNMSVHVFNFDDCIFEAIDKCSPDDENIDGIMREFPDHYAAYKVWQSEGDKAFEKLGI